MSAVPSSLAPAIPVDDEACYRQRVGELADALLTWPLDAVATRAAVAGICAEGLATDRWSRRDDAFGVALVEELAVRGLTSTAVVVSLHVESFVGMLRQFGRPELGSTLAAALAGDAVGCVAASEASGGSDLAAVGTTVARADGGWHVQGEKKFVTLADDADLAIVLAQVRGDVGDGRLAALVVPRDGYEVVRTHRLMAGSPLATSWIRIDRIVPDHHLLGRPGLGLAILNWGLTKERLAVAALVIGACRLALTLAIAHAAQRLQFGRRLLDHQVLRLRLANLDTQLHLLGSDLRALAAGPPAPRRVAGLKVAAARFAERCISECLHVFGGDGYVEDATPLGRLWRDVRLARIGGGTDEMMWEMVATGFVPDLETYARHISAEHPWNPHHPRSRRAAEEVEDGHRHP